MLEFFFEENKTHAVYKMLQFIYTDGYMVFNIY